MVNLKEDYNKEELEDKIIATFPLVQGNWSLDRGANQEKKYVDEEDGKVKIIEAVVYELDGGDKRFPINFYNDGNLLHEKPVKREPVSDKKLREVKRAIAQGRIDYLEGAAEALRALALTVPELIAAQYNQVANSIDFLFDHYKDEVEKYIARQTKDFETAVINETNVNVQGVLAIPVRQPDDVFPQGLTVKQSILHQLTGDPYSQTGAVT